MPAACDLLHQPHNNACRQVSPLALPWPPPTLLITSNTAGGSTFSTHLRFLWLLYLWTMDAMFYDLMTRADRAAATTICTYPNSIDKTSYCIGDTLTRVRNVLRRRSPKHSHIIDHSKL